MPSNCYWCVEGQPSYGSPTGTKGEPLACCSRCNVLCCGHHGQRDNGAQKFYCFDCDKTLLIISAVKAANVQADTMQQIGNKSKRLQADIKSGDLYDSFDDFIGRNPGYGSAMESIEDSYIDYSEWTDPELKEVFKSFPPDAQKLLVAAAIIIADTDSTEDLQRLGDPLLLNLKTSVKVPVYG